MYSIAERSLLTDALGPITKLIMRFSLLKHKTLREGLWIQRNKVGLYWTSIGLPKLQEFRNENAVTWKPSSLWFRHSYIIKHLLRRFSQPMIARLLKTARSLQILQEIGQIPYHQRVQEKNFHFGLSCKNVLIGLTLTCDVSRENWSNLLRTKSGQRTLIQGQWKRSNWIRKKKQKA